MGNIHQKFNFLKKIIGMGKVVITPKGTLMELIKEEIFAKPLELKAMPSGEVILSISGIKRGARLRLAEDIKLGDRMAKCCIMEKERWSMFKPICCRNLRLVED